MEQTFLILGLFLTLVVWDLGRRRYNSKADFALVWERFDRDSRNLTGIIEQRIQRESALETKIDNLDRKWSGRTLEPVKHRIKPFGERA